MPIIVSRPSAAVSRKEEEADPHFDHGGGGAPLPRPLAPRRGRGTKNGKGELFEPRIDRPRRARRTGDWVSSADAFAAFPDGAGVLPRGIEVGGQAGDGKAAGPDPPHPAPWACLDEWSGDADSRGAAAFARFRGCRRLQHRGNGRDLRAVALPSGA